MRLRHRGQAQPDGGLGVVDAHDGEVGRHPQAQPGRRPQRALRRPVAEAEQGRRPGHVRQDGGHARLSILDGAAGALGDRDAGPVDPGRLGRRPVAGQPVPGHRVGGRLLRGQVHQPALGPPGQPERDHAQAPVPQPALTTEESGLLLAGTPLGWATAAAGAAVAVVLRRHERTRS
ncbi:hypothetical protein MY520_01040 [Geodermatophilus sp. CPCC 205506]